MYTQTPRGFLKEGRPTRAGEKTVTYEAANRELASLIDEAVAPFTELVDWHQKEDVQREMRSKIKRLLRAGGINQKAVNSLALEIVDLAKVRTERGREPHPHEEGRGSTRYSVVPRT